MRSTSTATRIPARYAPVTVCFELDSAPPIPVISGAAVSHDDDIDAFGEGIIFLEHVLAEGYRARGGVAA